jgi:hypothetical protein
MEILRRRVSKAIMIAFEETGIRCRVSLQTEELFGWKGRTAKLPLFEIIMEKNLIVKYISDDDIALLVDNYGR